MSAEQVTLLLAWLVAAFVAVAALTWAIPMVARVAFINRTDALRDRVVDHIIDGELPADDPAVLEFLEIQDIFLERSREITLARTVGYEMCYHRMGMKPKPRESMRNLTPGQRKLIHSAEHDSKSALARYLVWGSPMGYVMYAAVRVVEAILPKTRHAGSSRAEIAHHAEPSKLAAETYNFERKVAEERRTKGRTPMGPTLLSAH